MCELRNEGGTSLTIGLARDHACAQFAATDGTPPYWMAVEVLADSSSRGDMEFCVGGTCTPIDGRYRLSLGSLEQVVASFVELGIQSPAVEWEEF